MHDSMHKSTGGGTNRLFKAKTTHAHFSPSYGVRKGLIKDPNWPPAHFPEEGKAMARRSLRVECVFQVQLEGGAPTKVTGDISLGGARFVAPAAPTAKLVEVLVDDHGTQVRARAEIISCQPHGEAFEYRARMIEAAEAEAIWHAVFQAA